MVHSYNSDRNEPHIVLAGLLTNILESGLNKVVLCVPCDGIVHLLCCQFIAAAVDAMYATEGESMAEEGELEQGIIVKGLFLLQICHRYFIVFVLWNVFRHFVYI